MNNKNEPKVNIFRSKIIIIGDANVGKTSLLLRYCNNDYKDVYDATTAVDIKKKLVNIEDSSMTLHIWDTAGSEKYQSLIRLYYRDAMGILLTYDVTSLTSFQNLDNWMKDINGFAPSHAQRVLVGLKCDDEAYRAVSRSEGETVAEYFKMPFIEVSSKENINVEKVFELIARKIKLSIEESDTEMLKDFVCVNGDQLKLQDSTTPKKKWSECKKNKCF
ncbi:ras-related protein Rab-13-like isoform X1 [Adelges cooleyi]|uniref:ras-related protein Rab-13-like isoform X1 n=1 Tax=Adelges cooleyi TaxID=133065 RepID=UPI0021802D86|nr:ras-related protein Rab-13-like isoform X1 [Adelges cooleyi]